MQQIKCREIIKATGGILISGNPGIEISNISTDSRTVVKGDFFIPLKGPNFDGHDFIVKSFESGAVGTLTEKDTGPAKKDADSEGDKIIIKVPDTAKALRDIAAYYRTMFNIHVAAVTGSVGKTATKDMIAGVLSRKFNVLKTEANLNNEIGLPLTIFKIDSFHEAAVFEMGMSGFGEISRLSSIAKPDIAVITNIGMAHIGKLGSRQNILAAKLEILEGLDKNGLVILNGDDALLSGMKGLLGFRTVFYGMEEGLDYQACDIRTTGESEIYFNVALGNNNHRFFIPSPGIHNVYNALASIAAGIELGVPVEKIIEGVSVFTPGKMRLNIISHKEKGFTVIDDAYNASPQSMEAAVNVLKNMSGSRKIAVLGDMLEMGGWALKSHMDLGKLAVSNKIDYIITVGENGRNIAIGALEAGAGNDRVYSFMDNKDAGGFLKDFVKTGDIILVKGSRGMKMEQIINILTADG